MGAPRIESYRFGHLVVDGEPYTQDVIILPERVVAGWWRKEGHALYSDDLADVLAARLDLLVVGQGANARMRVTVEAQRALEQAGTELIAQPTKEACETYNRLREQRVVAAALHLTC
jgi:hypothetical protein